MGVKTGMLNLRERLLLAVRERDRRFAVRRGQRSLLAAATPDAALLHHHDTTLFERLDGRRHAVVEQVEVACRDRAALKRLDELTLTDRGLGRRVVETLGREHDPSVLDRLDSRTLDRPRPVIALNDTRASTRRQKQTQALGKRCNVLAAHPACDTGGLGTKERFAEYSLDGLNARGIEDGVALRVAQLRRNVDDIARGRTVAKMN